MSNISSWTDLQNIKNDLSGSYTLTCNLNKNSPDYNGIGNNFAMLGNTTTNAFTGIFDGGGYTISDIVIDVSTASCGKWIKSDGGTDSFSSGGICISSDGKYIVSIGYRVSTSKHMLYRSSDYGKSWTITEAPIADTCGDICVSDNGKYVSISATGTPIKVSSDYGETWATKITANSVLGMSVDGKYQATCVNGGYIWISSDYGLTWNQATSAGNKHWNHIRISGDGRYMIADISDGGYLYVSNDYGATWQSKSSSSWWTALEISKNGKYQLAGTTISSVVSSDYGVNWGSTTLPANKYWRWFSLSESGQYQMACVDSEKIYMSGDYGLTWTISGINKYRPHGSMNSDGKFCTTINNDGIYFSYDGYTGLGLFDEVIGVIKNISLANIQYKNYVAVTSQGGVASAVFNSGLIENCHVISDLISIASSQCGGIVGSSGSQSLIKDCSYNGTITNGLVVALDVGGICGNSNTDCILENCYSVINIGNGFKNYGGLIGSVSNTLLGTLSINKCYSNCYSNSYGSNYSQGGLIGKIQSDNININNSFVITLDSDTKLIPLNFYIGAIAGFYDSSISSLNSVSVSNNYYVGRNTFGNMSFTRMKPSTMPNQSFRTIAMTPDHKYIIGVTTSTEMYISSDYGNSWETKVFGSLMLYASISDNGKYQTVGLDSTSSYGIYTSSDYGATWNSRGITGIDVYGVCMSADGKYQTACADYIYVSSDYGTTWQAYGPNKPWQSVKMSADGKYQTACYGFSSNGYIYTSLDYGQTWNQGLIFSGWSSICISASGMYQMAVAYSGTIRIAVSCDYGASWTPKSLAYAFVNNSISSDGQYQFAVNNSNYGIFTSFDYGNSWNQLGTGGSIITVSSNARYQMCNMGNGVVAYSNTDLQGIFNLNNASLLYSHSHPVYTSWDFNNIWLMSGQSFPDLKGEMNVWIGSGNWSNPSNWSKGLPTTCSKVLFDSTSTNNCTIDINTNITAMYIDSTYTGTITHSANVNVSNYFKDNT